MLVYKSQDVDWRKMRLAAQLKAAVETIDMLVVGFEQTSSLVNEGKWPAIDDKRAIHAFFADRVVSGAIPKELEPKDWSRFVDNIYRLFTIFEGRDLSSVMHRSLTRREEFLSCVDSAIEAYNHKDFPRSVSLFQFVLGTIATGCAATKSLCVRYNLPVSGEFRDLFGDVSVPAKPFE